MTNPDPRTFADDIGAIANRLTAWTVEAAAEVSARAAEAVGAVVAGRPTEPGAPTIQDWLLVAAARLRAYADWLGTEPNSPIDRAMSEVTADIADVLAAHAKWAAITVDTVTSTVTSYPEGVLPERTIPGAFGELRQAVSHLGDELGAEALYRTAVACEWLDRHVGGRLDDLANRLRDRAGR